MSKTGSTVNSREDMNYMSPDIGEGEHLQAFLKESDGTPYTVEDLIQMMGTSGWRNYMVISLILAVQIVLPCHLITYEFLGAYSDHHCVIPEFINSNWTYEQIKNYSIPFDSDTEEYSKCLIYDRDYTAASLMKFEFENIANISAPKIACTARKFLDSEIHSVVTDFDLTCERKWLYPTLGSASMLGTMIGSLFVGYLFDTFGRCRILVLAAPIYTVVGLLCAFSPNVTVFILLKVMMASLGMAFSLGPLTLSIELSSPSQRSLLGGVAGVFWSAGYMLVGLITYLVRPWRYLQIALVVPILFQVLNFWLIPESPRWLINKGRYEEAVRVLKLFANSNKKVLPDDDKLISIMHNINIKNRKKSLDTTRSFKKNVIELLLTFTAPLRYKELRLKFCLVLLCWFVVTMVYYGISLNATSFSSNQYLFVFISGLLEVPASMVSPPMLRFLGRRISFSMSYVIAGVIVFISLLYDNYFMGESEVLRMVLSQSGRFAIATAFNIAFTYTNELFPTKYRSIALGEASGMGRIGSITSPYINNLLRDISPAAPRCVFGLASFAAGISAFLLPETRGKALQDNVGAS